MAMRNSQYDVHPLLRHPRPIKRDSAKAQRMLGLIADSEDKIAGLQREKSKTTKWLERPLYEYLETSDIELENEGFLEEETKKCIDSSDMSFLGVYHRTSLSLGQRQCLDEKSEVSARTTLGRSRPHPIIVPQPKTPTSDNRGVPQYAPSPEDLRPYVKHRQTPSLPPQKSRIRDTSSSSDDATNMLLLSNDNKKSATYPPPSYDVRIGRPVSLQDNSSRSHYFIVGQGQSTTQRPRPTSFATYNQRDRRNSKIASSRGFRTNSYPNFSRPISDVSPRLVPGEQIEDDCVHKTYEEEQALPLGSLHTKDVSIGPFSTCEEDRPHTKSKHRWSTMPQTLKKITKRSSLLVTEEDQLNAKPPQIRSNGGLDRIPLLNHGDIKEPQSTTCLPPKRFSLLPTPTHSPLRMDHPLYEVPLPAPFAPWADIPPSPTVSIEQDQVRGSTCCSGNQTVSPRQSIASVISNRPLSSYSKRSSLAISSPSLYPTHSPEIDDLTTIPRVLSRKNTPNVEQSCVICKLAKSPSDMIDRRMAPNCWHEPATCRQCLRVWLETGLRTQGLNSGACPECGEIMTAEDIETFTKK